MALAAGAGALALSAPGGANVDLGRAPAHSLPGTVSYGSFVSRALRGVDRYSVYLPPGYSDTTRRYPVV